MEERSKKTAAAADQKKHAAPEARRGPGRPTLSNEKLLDKALDLFLEHGFEGTRIDDIAVLAGVAKRTIYQRYGDKETFFRAALQRAIDEFVLPVEKLQAEERDDLAETLLGLGRLLVANLLTPAGLRLLRITNAESYRRPEFGEYSYRYGTERTLNYLADLFRRRLSLARPPEAAMAFLYLVVWGPATMAAWGVSLDMKAVDDHAIYCVNLFLDGLKLADRTLASSKPARSATTAVTPTPTTTNTSVEQEAADLRIENRQLRNLLVESMLEIAAMKERLASAS